MLLANFNRKEHLRHRAVSLRQHGFLVYVMNDLYFYRNQRSLQPICLPHVKITCQDWERMEERWDRNGDWERQGMGWENEDRKWKEVGEEGDIIPLKLSHEFNCNIATKWWDALPQWTNNSYCYWNPGLPLWGSMPLTISCVTAPSNLGLTIESTQLHIQQQLLLSLLQIWPSCTQ